jgi:hypothetical protein
VRDWTAYALTHLNSLRIAPARKQEVARELSGHLAEFYEELRSRGIPEQQAFLETCAQVGNWAELCDGVLATNKEVSMLDRIKQIWLPASVTFVFAYAALMFLEVARTRWMAPHVSGPRGVAFYLPWFLALPLVGAASAYMSRRAQAHGWRVYLAASFPSLVIAGVFWTLFVLYVMAGPQRPSANPAAFARMLFDWAILPALVLCVGVALQGVLGKRATIQ